MYDELIFKRKKTTDKESYTDKKIKTHQNICMKSDF